jgi:hypothetical protein
MTVDERLVDRDWGGCSACNAVFAVRLVAENVEVSLVRGLQDRRASAKNAEIKGCGWVNHILFSM